MTSIIANSDLAGNVVISRRTTMLATTDAEPIIPFQLAAFQPEPYAILNGHPDVPDVWIHTNTLVSTTGEYYSGDRLQPMDVVMNAQSRFIATDSTWDSLGGIWLPAQTTGINYYWASIPGLAPTLEDVDYLVGKEMISVQGLRFTPGDYLFSSFNSGNDDAADMTIVIAALIHSTEAATIFTTDPSVDLVSIDVGQQFTFSYQNGVGKVKTSPLPVELVPVYIVLSISPPQATMYISTGPTTISATTVRTNTFGVSHLKYLLGKTRGGKATSSMTILEMSIFPYAVGNLAVHDVDDDGVVTDEMSIYQLLAKYASIYGAS